MRGLGSKISTRLGLFSKMEKLRTCLKKVGVVGEGERSKERKHVIRIVHATVEAKAEAGTYSRQVCSGRAARACVHLPCRDLEQGASRPTAVSSLGVHKICTLPACDKTRRCI